jgi:hypothetical protein
MSEHLRDTQKQLSRVIEEWKTLARRTPEMFAVFDEHHEIMERIRDASCTNQHLPDSASGTWSVSPVVM